MNYYSPKDFEILSGVAFGTSSKAIEAQRKIETMERRIEELERVVADLVRQVNGSRSEE
jgi:hypothetical protein